VETRDPTPDRTAGVSGLTALDPTYCVARSAGLFDIVNLKVVLVACYA
jgi:hypothetical protein